MYDEQQDVLSRVSEEERKRLDFEKENFTLQPRKKTWWELEEELDAASTFEDLLSPEEVRRWLEKGLITDEQAETQLKKWSELSH